MKNSNLERRLVKFAASILSLIEAFPKNAATRHLSDQLLRSGTSAALNYGEAQAAESRRDFIHKVKISLKELKETYICLQILRESGYLEEGDSDSILDETNQLIAIFVASLKTAQAKDATKKL